MAEDVVLYSPVITDTFNGREAARELFGVLFEALESFEITHEFAGERTHAFFWSATGGGRGFEGCDLVFEDGTGKISEIRVQIRTLVGIARFASAVGPPLARSRGPVRAAVAALLNPTLQPLFAAIDSLATSLTNAR
jgi:hypothetical protein